MLTRIKSSWKLMAASLACSVMFFNSAAFADPIINTATGNIAGVTGTVGDGAITLDRLADNNLKIVKEAYGLDGSLIASSATTTTNNKVVKGQTIWIQISVANESAAQIADLRITDNLGSTGLTYAGGLEYQVVSPHGGAIAWTGGPYTPPAALEHNAGTVSLGHDSVLAKKYNLAGNSKVVFRFQVTVN